MFLTIFKVTRKIELTLMTFWIPRENFNLNNRMPKLNPNVEPIIGWVEDTLVNFLETHKPKINFVHLDINVYSSSKFVLEKLNLT